MNITGGSTDVTTYFVLRQTSDGTAKTGATITDIDLQYVRTGASPSAKVDATALAAANSAHADNKAIEVDGTDAPGLYRVDWPDAAFAAGVKQVILSVKLANCFTEHMAVEIDPPVDVTKISGDSDAADNCELMFDGTGYAGGSTKLDVDTVTIEGGDASDAINAACDTALTDYDAPTKAEMDAGFAALNDVSAADVNAQVDQSIEDYKLDHLVAVADGDDPVNNSIIAKLAASDGDWSGFSAANDSLEALRDRGDAGWVTATGFSTHNAAAVITALWASKGWDDTNTLAFGDAWEHVWAITAGNVVRTGDAYAYKKPNDSTTAITETVASTTRTRS